MSLRFCEVCRLFINADRTWARRVTLPVLSGRLEFLLRVTRIYAQNPSQVNSQSVVQCEKVLRNFPEFAYIKKTIKSCM
jgi:hypothetical protein